MKVSNHVCLLLFVFFLILLISPYSDALEIDSCQALSTDGESYILNKSISSNGTCFTITESNIMLDCSGFSVTGNATGYGINLSNVDNVTVTNCRLANFSTGIIKEEFYPNYNITIRDNMINTSVDNGPGIYMLSVLNTIISNNTIYTIGDNSHALNLNPGVNYSQITYNTLNAQGDNSFGIFPALSNYNNISNNVIETHGFESDCLDSPMSDHNYIGNNIVTVYGEGGGGIHIVYNSSHNIIDNNTITILGDDNSALELCEFATNNTMSNNEVTILGGDNIGLEICDSAYNNTIINSVFNASNPIGILLVGAGDDNVLTNVTFDSDDIEFESPFTGSVIVKWFVNVSVRDPNGTLSSEAVISAYNESSDLADSEVTGNSGEVQFILTEFWQNYTDKVYSTPHTINVTKAPYANESSEVNLSVTESTSLNFQLLEFITSCGQTITNSSALNQSLQCNGVGIIIGNHNITLDCKGFNITENHTQEGVRCYHWDNLTVRNCLIYNAGPAAIYYFNSSYGLVENNTVINSSKNESGGWIGHGIVMSSGSSYNTIRNNTAINNTMTGFIPIENDSAYNIFIYNYATGHGDQGMEIENGAHHNYFYYNTIVGNHFGITLSPGTHDNVVMGNTVNDTKEAAFEIYNSSGNLIEDNYVYNASKGANFGGSPSNNTIRSNTFINAYSGIMFAAYSQNTTASGNLIKDCGEGIFFQNATNITVTGNTFQNNQYEVHMGSNSQNIQIFNNAFIGDNLINPEGVFSWNNDSVGNRWSTFDQPAEGCEDANSDKICDSSFSIGGGNIDYFPIALVQGAVTQNDNNGKGGSSSGTVSSGGTVLECASDLDCSGVQVCTDGDCVNITCECGYIEEHSCLEYECCDNSTCPEGMECADNTCVVSMNETARDEALELIELVGGLLQERTGQQGLGEAEVLFGKAQEVFLNGDFELARNLSLQAFEAIECIDNDSGYIMFFYLLIVIISTLSLITVFVLKRKRIPKG